MPKIEFCGWRGAWPHLVLLFLFQLVALRPSDSFDVFMYFAIAREILATQSLPLVDPFLHSIQNYHWNIGHAWLSVVIFHGLHVAGGFPLLVAMQLVINLATLSLPLVFGRRMSAPVLLTCLVVGVAIMSAQIRFALRTSIFSDFLIVLSLFGGLLHYRKGTKLLFFFPILYALWINLHPAFLVGLFALSFPFWSEPKWLLTKQGRSLALVIAASAAACLLNPKGLEGFLFPFKTIFDSDWGVFRASNFEWMAATDPLHRWSIPSVCFYVLSVVAMGFLLSRFTWARLGRFAFCAILIVMGLSAFRHIAWASVCLTLLLIDDVSSRKMELNQIWRKAIATGLVLGAVVAGTYVYGFTKVGTFVRSGFKPFFIAGVVPDRAAAFMVENGLRDGIFNDFGFGAYLAYSLPRDYKIYVHGFVDDQNFLRDHYHGINQDEASFDRVVALHGLQVFVMNRASLPAGTVMNSQQVPFVYTHLATSDDWRLVYLDESALIFVRNSPKYADLIRRTGLNIGRGN